MDRDLVGSMRSKVPVHSNTSILNKLNAILIAKFKHIKRYNRYIYVCFRALQFDVGVGIALDVDHEGGGGVQDELRVPQLDQEHGSVGGLPFLTLISAHYKKNKNASILRKMKNVFNYVDGLRDERSRLRCQMRR